MKKLHTPDYRHYLRLWNQGTKNKLDNMKDLPKLNQVRALRSTPPPQGESVEST